MKTLSKYVFISALLFMCSLGFAVNNNNDNSKSTKQLTTFLETFEDLAAEFDLTEIQKNKMIWALYEHVPKLYESVNQMFTNRKELLGDQADQNSISMARIELHADAQGQLLRQLIIDKELLKEEVNSILNPQQRSMLSGLFEQLLLDRLGLFYN